MANETIKQTTINGKLIGTLTEKALTLETGVAKKGADGKNYTADIIKGKLVVDGIEVRVYTQSHTAKGENKMFKGIQTIYETYTDKVEAAKNGTEADVIDAGIKYECNDYVGQDGAMHTGTQISLFRASRVSSDAEHQAEVDIDGAVIRKIAPIIKNEEETGDLTVEVATFDYNGKLKPLTFIVEEDLSEGFMDMYKAGQTVRLYVELKTETVGDVKPKKAAFGKKANVTNSYTTTKAVIMGGEEAYEDEEKVYDLELVKKAMQERDIELEAMVKQAKEKPKSTGNSGLNGAGNKPKGGLGKKANVPAEDEDSPF